MKKLNSIFKTRLLPLLVTLVLLVSFFGIAVDAAFAKETKNITADVDFRIEVVNVFGDNHKRAYGKIWFSGIKGDGVFLDGEGSVFFTPDTDGSPLTGSLLSLSADVIVNGFKGTKIRKVGGSLSNIVIDVIGAGVIEGRGIVIVGDILSP